tara:strand:+ start:2204 stop:2851 length:648 start_codon:yes stop_codon:yes gene_type:complete
MSTSSLPSINNHPRVDINQLIEKQEVVLLENFYSDLDWLNNEEVVRFPKLSKSEQVIHLASSHRLNLQQQASKLFPEMYYPTDAGWIRSNIYNKNERPLATHLHSDNPYIVLAVCLSSPKTNPNTNSFGTEFYKHRDLGFKKVFAHPHAEQFNKAFMAHKHDEQKWEAWFTYPFKENTAIIYDGSLLHKMPWPLFDDAADSARLLQVFNFRIKKK